MKGLLLFLILATTYFGNAQFISEDDMLHFTGGAVLSSATYAFVYGKTKNKDKAFWYGVGVSAFAGLTKELLDEYSFGGRFDTGEAIATLIGGLTAAYTFRIFTGKKRKKKRQKLKKQRPPNSQLSVL